MPKKSSIAILLAALLGACTATYQYNAPPSNGAKLDPARGVVIAVPENGSYGRINYPNSGDMTAKATQGAFLKQALNVDIDRSCKGIKCLVTVDASKYLYLILPKILHWEDRATEWSGLSDKIEISVAVYNTITKKKLKGLVFTGASKWATNFWFTAAFGGDHPQDLLRNPLNQFAKSLY